VQTNVAGIISGSVPFTGNITMQKDLVVGGNLSVGGTTTTINAVDTVIADRVLTLSNGAVSGAFDSGLIIARGSDSNVFIGFDESADQFVVGYTSEPGGNAVTNYTISSYANVRFNNITVDGTVDGVDIAGLSSGINGIQANINSVQGNVTSLTTSVNTIAANVNSVQTNVIAVETRATANINAVQSNVTSLTTSVNTIRANVDTVQSNVTALTTSVNTIAANVNSVQGNVTALTTSVNTIAANVNAVQGNVTALTTSVNTIAANVNSVSSNVANIINGTTQFTGAVTFQDNVSADRAILNTQLQIGSNVTSSVGAASTTIFTFPGATYRGAELLLMVQDVTNSQYQLSKMLIVHNGNVVDWTEYGVITTGTTDLTTFSAAIDGSDVITVSSTGGSANKKITVASHYLIQ
jgi:archaellum component FlaC